MVGEREGVPPRGVEDTELTLKWCQVDNDLGRPVWEFWVERPRSKRAPCSSSTADGEGLLVTMVVAGC